MYEEIIRTPDFRVIFYPSLAVADVIRKGEKAKAFEIQLNLKMIERKGMVYVYKKVFADLHKHFGKEQEDRATERLLK